MMMRSQKMIRYLRYRMRKWASVSTGEKQGAIFAILLLTLSALVMYFYETQAEVSSHMKKVQKIRELTRQVALAREEYFYAQMEVWELGSMPSAERFHEFYHHEKLFTQNMQAVYHLFAESGLETRPHFEEQVKLIQRNVPILQGHWHEIVSALEHKASRAKINRLLVSAEKAFDQIRLDQQLHEAMDSQWRYMRETELQIAESGSHRTLVMLLGLLIALALGVVVYIMDRIVLMAQFNQLQVVQSSKLVSLGELSAGVAHELNTPLMLIKGFNQRVQSLLRKSEHEINPKIWDYLREVDEGADRMIRIVHHFRDFSRQSHHELSVFTINSVVERSFTLLNEQLRLHGITVVRDFTTDDPQVKGDANRLEQVFLNLITNARDVLESPQHTLASKVITVRTHLDREFAIVEFEDNGPGIPHENLHRIFDPFFTTKPIGKGTGLGLSVSQGIIRDHQGHLDVHSGPGGTRFTIALPIAKNNSLTKFTLKSKTAA